MMQMAKILFDQAAALLAANAADLSDPTADFIRLRLIGADFAISPTLTKADLTLIDASLASVGISATPAACYVLADIDNPYTRRLLLFATSGGWYFNSDGTDMPLTVYGVALLGHDEDDLWGVTRFDTPKTITRVNTTIDLVNTMFSIPPTALIA